MKTNSMTCTHCHTPKIMMPQVLSLPQPNSIPSIIPFLTAFSIVILIFICIIIFSVVASFVIIIFIYIICQYFIGLGTFDGHGYDIESGGSNESSERAGILISHDHHSMEVEGIENNIWLEVLARTIEAIEERKGMRRQALEKMGPPMSYGGFEMALKCIDCAICLEDFESGELCQVFPMCKHIFHYGCIQNWLKKNVTCPICRCSILNE